MACGLSWTGCRPVAPQFDPGFKDVAVVQGLTPFLSESRAGQNVDHFEVHRTIDDVSETLRRDRDHRWKETVVAGMETFITTRPSPEYSLIQVSISPGRNGVYSGAPESAAWSVVMVVRKK